MDQCREGRHQEVCNNRSAMPCRALYVIQRILNLFRASVESKRATECHIFEQICLFMCEKLLILMKEQIILMERVISCLSISRFCSVREGQNILLMGLFTVTGRLSGGIRGSKKHCDLTQASVVGWSIARLLWHLNSALQLPH